MMGAGFCAPLQRILPGFRSPADSSSNSPYPVPLDMFNARPFRPGSLIYRRKATSWDKGTLVNSFQEGTWREVRYRFYQNNIMVIVQMQGADDFVSLENAYQLAGIIAAQLPESFPALESLTTLPA